MQEAPTTSPQQPIHVAIIGTGFGGQSAAIHLLKQEQLDFVMLERRSFMGGTWCQNSYPGAQVDVQSPLYSLASEPQAWSQMFAEQAELEAYTNRVIDKYQLREKTVLNFNVIRLTWLDESRCWKIESESGDSLYARYVISAQGPLSNPVIPDFNGRERFQGKSFHTNQWDHSYDYRNKRVAVIGSGASAAQVIPAIAPDVQHLHVFQRTPHWVLPRPDRTFSPTIRKLLGSKFVYHALRKTIYWALEWRVFAFKYAHGLMRIFAQRPALKHLRKQVPNEVLRRKLTPDYTIGCKRIIVSNTLYPALSRENVTLHDKHDGIAEITENGIKTTQGSNIELDLIVYSTGFDATDGAVGYEIIGRTGSTLKDFWHEFPRAYLGTTAPKFPNLFLVTGPNTGIGHTSAIFVIESQMQYIMRALRFGDKHGGLLEVTEQAEADYTTMIHREMRKTVWHSGGCNSWYKSKSGHVIAMYPGFSFVYRMMARRFKPQHHRTTTNAIRQESS